MWIVITQRNEQRRNCCLLTRRNNERRVGPQDLLYGSRLRRRPYHGCHCQEVPKGTVDSFWRRGVMRRTNARNVLSTSQLSTHPSSSPTVTDSALRGRVVPDGGGGVGVESGRTPRRTGTQSVPSETRWPGFDSLAICSRVARQVKVVVLDISLLNICKASLFSGVLTFVEAYSGHFDNS